MLTGGSQEISERQWMSAITCSRFHEESLNRLHSVGGVMPINLHRWRSLRCFEIGALAKSVRTFSLSTLNFSMSLLFRYPVYFTCGIFPAMISFMISPFEIDQFGHGLNTYITLCNHLQ
jgi:hypothetical protein